MLVSPDDKFLALYGTSDVEVRIFDLRSGQLYASFERIGRRRVSAVSFRSDCEQVVFGNSRGEAELWNLESRNRLWSVQAQTWTPKMAAIVCVAFSPRNDLVAWLGDNHFGLLDAVSGENLVEQLVNFNADQSCLAWASDGMQLLTSEWGGMVRIWKVSSAKSTRQIQLLFECNTLYDATFCSFFDSHRRIITNHGTFLIPPQHRPACAADDLLPPSPESLLRLRKDGWIWLVGGREDERRICWIPPAFRPVQPMFETNIATFRDSVWMVGDSRRFVVLDWRTCI